MGRFRSFSWKDTNLRVACDKFDLVVQTVVSERKVLEAYIKENPEYRDSLVPVFVSPDSPEIVKRMANASKLTGLGPMASVAGTLAQAGAEAAHEAGCSSVIVENGGDMYIFSDSPVTVGIYAGQNSVADSLAFRITANELPLALCSSSSRMGHSLSLGDCDLATVLAQDAALADSAATLTCNRITSSDSMETILEEVGRIPGVRGILAVKNDRICLWGKLPQIVRNRDPQTISKITVDKNSNGVQ